MDKKEALRYYMEVTQGVEKNTSDAFQAGYNAGKEDTLESQLPPCATLSPTVWLQLVCAFAVILVWLTVLSC